MSEIHQLATSYPQVNVVAVPPGGEPAGHRSVSINVNFNTMKVLMYKYSSTFQFAVSEVEFFTCTSRKILVINFTMNVMLLKFPL